MIVLIKTFFEGIRQAGQSLLANKLRSFLSLLGITIGIFCIIGVQSAVDSLEDNVKGSLKKLGDDSVYLQKMPWNENPRENFWKYQRRPDPSYKDYEVIKTKVKSAGVVDYHVFIGTKTVKYRSSSVDRVFVAAVTSEFDEFFEPGYDEGRWYTSTEYHYGVNKVLIGHTVAEELFGALNPIGKKINLMGHKMEVIGVFEKSGKDILKVMDYDEAIIISYELAKKVANVKNKNPFGSAVNIKAAEGVSVERLKDDLTGVLRSSRRLKPKEEDNFALNSMSFLADILDNVFNSLGLLAFIIGGFAIFVGMFSVANIMFVSVKERTKIIGIKKAVGAKRHIILLEFLIESIILCLLGGAIGLALTQLVVSALSSAIDFEIYLDSKNVINGILISVIVGIIAGFIPAWQAAKMDPVVAMRK
ncbi:MAG: ABC transporter permease [Bacteroidetes bacterium]|jgi:putative ABC transport system permease protein|nr:ABC transporter permease [Bacteroidota bacterium]